jgi:hypothetical protein
VDQVDYSPAQLDLTEQQGHIEVDQQADQGKAEPELCRMPNIVDSRVI